MTSLPNLVFHPLTTERWHDFEMLFGKRGACGGCWCMWPRLTAAEFEKHKGMANKKAMKRIVEAGPPPGLLAYVDGLPIAWCALAPRETYSRLERSRVLKPVDESPVWSTVCFFVAKPYRHRGVTAKLLGAAGEYARQQGAQILEGYPVESQGPAPTPDVFVWTGRPSAFRKAGFKEVLRRSKIRPIMRRYL